MSVKVVVDEEVLQVIKEWLDDMLADRAEVMEMEDVEKFDAIQFLEECLREAMGKNLQEMMEKANAKDS